MSNEPEECFKSRLEDDFVVDFSDRVKQRRLHQRLAAESNFIVKWLMSLLRKTLICGEKSTRFDCLKLSKPAVNG